jgi:hypothetical protein
MHLENEALAIEDPAACGKKRAREEAAGSAAGT